MTAEILAVLRRNLAEIRERILAAAERSGRSSDDVQLLPVTKYVDARAASALFDLGCPHLAESRPQELWQKAKAVPQAKWHLVGHLQRNKVERTLPLVQMIQSVDSLRLMDALQQVLAAKENRRLPVLLEVNISGEAAKHGFSPEEIPSVLDRLAEFPNLEIRGFLGMSALAKGPDRARVDFSQLRTARDQWRQQHPECGELRELSMGMSDDFEVAIEEGATIVRVGSALFKGMDD